MENSGSAMTLVYDGADGFKRQGPLPVSLKKDDVLTVVIVNEIHVGAHQGVAPEGPPEALDDETSGWNNLMELVGCIKDKDGATDVSTNHDRYLYGDLRPR
ncbi:MAG: hypothetical protein ABI672_19460 [Vicinamibacteria bacterium]